MQASSPIPHDTLAETDATFFAASRLVRQTGSYPRDRALAVLGHTGLLAGALLGAVLLTAVLSMLSKAVGGVVFLAAVLAFALLLVPFVERRFFAMRCAFAFLVTQVLLRRSAIPPTGTTAAAQQFLSQRFGDLAGPIYDAHMDVRNNVSRFFRSFDRVGEVLPLDVGPLRNALGWLIDRVAPHIADLCLSHALARGATDYTSAADDAVSYVAQNPKALLSTAIRAWITERVLGSIVSGLTLCLFGGATFGIALATATSAASSQGVPTEGAQTVGIFAALFAAVLVGGPLAWLASWFVRTAFLQPVALTMLLIRYHATIQGQAVDPSIRSRLHGAQRGTNLAGRLAGLFE